MFHTPAHKNVAAPAGQVAESSKAPNFIYVEEDDSDDTVLVHDVTGAIHNLFEGGTKLQRRAAATSYAKKQAEDLGCDWGENW